MSGLWPIWGSAGGAVRGHAPGADRTFGWLSKGLAALRGTPGRSVRAAQSPAIGRPVAPVPGGLAGRARSAAPGATASGPRTGRPSPRPIRAKYDAAQTTVDNHRHWLLADGLSADAAASPAVRRVLRNRARYEVANNSYARGIALTVANDVVGTGPRLQLTGVAGDDARQVEAAFAAWARAIDLAEKLRGMRLAQLEDGEAFALLVSNPATGHAVSLDLRLVEADQIATPDLRQAPMNAVDGIVFDAFGNPAEYHLLKVHPGSGAASRPEAVPVPAAAMLHLFRPDRPGQRRGVPEITPALPLFAQLRRYTLAVLAAAETAADYAGIVYTDAPAGGEADPVEPMDRIQLEQRTLLTMPGGWRMEQLRAEQPATTYAEFKHEILNEIARCLNLPFNIAAGNSSGYNYASGRLDHQTYFKSIRVDQSRLATRILDRIFAAWIREAMLVEDLLPQGVRSVRTDWSHQWFWDGHEHVDPAKEANAQATRLQSNTTTLADEYARRGQDWESQLRQRARELALMRELGLSPEQAAPPAPAPAAKPAPADAPDQPNPDAGDDVDARAA